MKNLILLFFISLVSSSFSQNFDSLIYVSIKLEHDTDRVNLFYDQGFLLRYKAIQFSYDCAKQAEYFAQRSNSIKHLAKANNLLGILYYRKGDLNTALNFHQKALEARKSVNDEQGIAFSETNLGNIYTDLGKYTQAEQSYLRALQFNSKLGNEVQIGNCYLNLGVLKTNTKAFDEAERYFYYAYKIAKNTINYELEAMSLNNLAVINLQRKEFEAAISNCMDALKVKEMMGNDMEKTDSYINLANAYFHLQQKENSFYYLNKADSMCRVFDYPEALAELLKLKSEIFEAYGEFNAALYNYKKHIRLCDSLEKINAEAARLEFFNEQKQIISRTKEPFSFPYLMLILLVALTFFIAYTLFKLKR
jgi:tetratricopeptide (TPR) repeat protein